jgi:hypothetical protein
LPSICFKESIGYRGLVVHSIPRERFSLVEFCSNRAIEGGRTQNH